MTSQHGCRFDWCENDSTGSEAQRLEHFATPDYVPVTGGSATGFGCAARELNNENLPVLGVGIRFNEDLDAAPMIYVDAPHESSDYVLRLDEAVWLYHQLGQAIVKACKGTNLSPKRITAFYSREDK